MVMHILGLDDLFSMKGPALLFISNMLNIWSYINRSTFSFVLSSIVTTLAGIYYFHMIQKLRAEKRKSKSLENNASN